MPRIRRALNVCVAQNADLIAFQEIWSKNDAAKISAEARQSGYEPVINSNKAGTSSGGLLALVRAKTWSIDHSATFKKYHAHASAWKLYEADGLGHKGILRVDVRNKTNLLPVSFFSTHLQSQYGRRTYEEIRYAQAVELTRALDEVSKQQICVISGDFNTSPGDRRVYEVLSSRYQDLTTPYRTQCVDTKTPSCGTFFESANNLDWIDYAWLRSTAGVTASCEIKVIPNVRADLPYSDHNGVEATITFRKAVDLPINRVLNLLRNRSRLSRRGFLGAVFHPQDSRA